MEVNPFSLQNSSISSVSFMLPTKKNCIRKESTLSGIMDHNKSFPDIFLNEN